MAAVKHRQRLEARAAMEEEMMTRVPLSKEEAKKLKQQQRSNMAGAQGGGGRCRKPAVSCRRR